MAKALIFPGQGSQKIGMGEALAEAFPVAREVFEEVDDALDQHLSRLMWEGEQETLNLTANTQPALMAHSMAVLRVLQKEVGLECENAMFVAGHSLGEYSALCAAGAISLSQTAKLLRIRGDAMQAAVPPGEGAMAALIGVDLDGAEKAVAAILAANPDAGVLEIANDNAPGQVVVSGTKAQVETLAAEAKSHGAKMAKLLPVSAPFHCSLMAPAADAMAAALEKATVNAPATTLVANITAQPVLTPGDIRSLLVKQVTGRVRWTQSVQYMVGEGADEFVEIGTGKVLAGLVKRIAPDASNRSIGEPADIESFAKS